MFYLLEVVRGQLRWQKKIRKFGNLWRLWGTRDVKRGSTDVRDPQCENKKLAVLLTSTLPGNQLTVSSQTDWENKLIWVMAGWAMLSNIL
jgi:hypothetical protein